MMDFKKELIFLNRDFGSREELFDEIGALLTEKQIVKPEYTEEIIKRENNFPTGIPLEDIPVAMPHVEAKYVNENTMFVVTAPKGIEFDNAEDDGTVEVKIVFGLLVNNPDKHLEFLMKLVDLFQKKEVLKKIYMSGNEEDVINILREDLN